MSQRMTVVMVNPSKDFRCGSLATFSEIRMFLKKIALSGFYQSTNEGERELLRNAAKRHVREGGEDSEAYYFHDGWAHGRHGDGRVTSGPTMPVGALCYVLKKKR